MPLETAAYGRQFRLQTRQSINIVSAETNQLAGITLLAEQWPTAATAHLQQLLRILQEVQAVLDPAPGNLCPLLLELFPLLPLSFTWNANPGIISSLAECSHRMLTLLRFRNSQHHVL